VGNNLCILDDETVTGTGTGTGTGTTDEITKFSSYQSNERTGNTTNPPYVLGDSEVINLNKGVNNFFS